MTEIGSETASSEAKTEHDLHFLPLNVIHSFTSLNSDDDCAAC